jgi:hypothetical protein
MFDQFRTISRRRGRTLLAALVALIAAIPGCDKKVAWRGVSTDSRDAGRVTSSDAAPEEPIDGNTR